MLYLLLVRELYLLLVRELYLLLARELYWLLVKERREEHMEHEDHDAEQEYFLRTFALELNEIALDEQEWNCQDSPVLELELRVLIIGWRESVLPVH
jgi:hypothetical protein